MNVNRKILIVDRYFYPDLQATSVLLTDLALALSAESDVTVLCGPTSSFCVKDSLGIEKISVIRVPSFQFNNPNFLERFLNYSSFLLIAPLALLCLQKPHILLVQSSPPLLPFVTSLVCRVRGIPYVYVCQDLFPGTAVRSGQLKESWFTRWSEWCHKEAIRFAQRIVAIGRDMKQVLIEKGVPEGKIEVISNWASNIGAVPAQKNNSFFTVMHAGNFGLVQDFDFLLDIAKELEGASHIRLVFVGSGTCKEGTEKKAKAMNLKNLTFLPFAEKEKVSDMLSGADLQVISLKPGLAGYSVPSKTYSLLASGSAILGLMETASEAAQIIKEADCGFVIEKRNPVKAAEIIKELAKSPQKITEWKKNAKAFSDRMNYKARAINQYKQILFEGF